jgi:nucleoside-diphosphate-sugar epimerase
MDVPRRRPRALVTGGSGFVGRPTVMALVERGWEVHVATRGGVAPQATPHRFDLLREDAGELVRAIAPDAILHLAWRVEPRKFWTDPANLDWVAASLRLARAAAEGGVRRFVGVGTCYEYDWPNDAPCFEGVTPLAAHTLYDTTKAALAAILRRYFADAGVGFAWARPFHLFGAGEDTRRFVASVARALVRGEPALCTRALPIHDFLDARDAGAALAAVVASDYCGDVNIGSGAPVRLADVAETLADLVGRRDLLRLGALPDRLNEPLFVVADTRILREKIGFAPQFELRAGLAAAIEDCRSRRET